MADSPEDIVLVGKISGVFGIKGWVKVFSYTQPRENILQYRPWLLKQRGVWQKMTPLDGRAQGKGVVAHLQGFDDPDMAQTLIGCEIGMYRSQLPELDSGEYYWNDLIGCRVVSVEGIEFGQVKYLIETGSNDVLVVEGEQEVLIPFIQGSVIQQIDLQQKLIRVDWDPSD